MWSAIILIPILIGVCAFIYVLFNRLDKYDKEKFNKRNIILKEKLILGDYLFCFHQKFSKKSISFVKKFKWKKISLRYFQLIKV